MKNGGLAALAAVSLSLLAAPSAAAAITGGVTVPVINSIAGGQGGPDPGTNVSLTPCGESAGGGVTYVSNGYAIYRLNPVTDWLDRFAGGPDYNQVQDGLPASGASLTGACGTATDGNGNLLLTDSVSFEDSVIRVIAAHTGTYYGRSMTAGRIYTIAGGGSAGLGDGGPALAAHLTSAQSVTTDRAGNVVITDASDGRIRVVAAKNGSFYGQQMKAGDIYTAFARAGSMEQTAVDRWGNLVFSDFSDSTGTSAVWVVAETSGSFYGQQMSAGVIYQIAPLHPVSIPWNQGLALDGAGNVVFGNDQIVQVVAARSGTFYGQSMTIGHVYTVAGGGTSSANGVPALQAAIPNGYGLTVDGAGNLVFGQGDSRTRAVAATSGTFYGRAMKAGDIYTVAGNGRVSYSGDGGPATAAELGGAAGTGVDRAGNFVIADSNNGVIRVLANASGAFYGQQMTKGDIYTVAGGGNLTPDGVPALQASLLSPNSVAVDAAGNVIIADLENEFSGRIRVIAESSGSFYGRQMVAGDIYTLAGLQGHAVHLDRNKNLVIADPLQNAINVLAAANGVFYGQTMTAGHVYQIAGGGPGSSTTGVPALQASVFPYDFAFDATGNLVIAQGNILSVIAVKPGTFYGQQMKAEYIYTVTGTGGFGPGGNGIPALKAQLNRPQAVAIDTAGNLVIGDTYDNEVRVVAVKTGTFYAQAMKAEYIYLIAGNHSPFFGGDGGPASQATLNGPWGLRIVPGGGILISDDGRLRLISG